MSPEHPGRPSLRLTMRLQARAFVPACLVLLALLMAGAAASAPAGGPEPATVVITDLLDRPYDLRAIAAGVPTLLFICDPALTKCREGAVYFDAQAASIEASRIKPVCVFLATTGAARDAAVRLGLGVPVYVDSNRTIPTALLGQEILPAMVLLDGEGRVERVALGGGESLDSNLTHILKLDKSRWRFLSVLIPLAVFAIILLVAE
jgi:hypothetical protein